MTETEFIDKEMTLDSKMEDIYRIIEQKMLLMKNSFKEGFSLSESQKEIDWLTTTVDRLRELKKLYLVEKNDWKIHEVTLISTGLNPDIKIKIEQELDKIIEEVDQYGNSLIWFAHNIRRDGNRISEYAKQITEHYNQIEELYSAYIKNNENIISNLRTLRISIKN